MCGVVTTTLRSQIDIKIFENANGYYNTQFDFRYNIRIYSKMSCGYFIAKF